MENVITGPNFNNETGGTVERTQDELDAELYNNMLSICRKERDRLLSDTDWVHLPDVTISEERKQQFINYRQQLRDMTDTFTSWYNNMPEQERYSITNLSIPWPEKP